MVRDVGCEGQKNIDHHKSTQKNYWFLNPNENGFSENKLEKCIHNQNIVLFNETSLLVISLFFIYFLFDKLFVFIYLLTSTIRETLGIMVDQLRTPH